MKSSLPLLLLSLFIPVAAHAQATEEIKLAVVAPVSGNFAPYGTEIVRGAKLAVAEVSSESSPVRLLVEDACLPAQTVGAAHKLININKIQAIVGSYCVVGMVPMVAITERNKVIAFHSSAVANAILSAGDYTFTTNVTARDEATELARYAYSDLGARRAASIYIQFVLKNMTGTALGCRGHLRFSFGRVVRCHFKRRGRLGLQTRREAKPIANGGIDLVGDGWVLLQEILGVFTTLAQAHLAIGIEATALGDDFLINREIKNITHRTDAFIIHNVKFGRLGGARNFVFLESNARTAAD